MKMFLALIVLSCTLATPAVAVTPPNDKAEFITIGTDHDRVCRRILDDAIAATNPKGMRYPSSTMNGKQWFNLFKQEGCDPNLLMNAIQFGQVK